jgi:tetratricopeptide (TPR) repeat protein
MKKIFLVVTLLSICVCNSFAQTEKLSDEATKEILSQLKMDTTIFLKDAADKACKCIDSINNRDNTTKEVSAKIASCIDKEVSMYQLMLQMNRTLFSGNKNNTIYINDKDSKAYKLGYFEIERRLRDSCNALTALLRSNEKQSDKSASDNSLAIKEYNKGVEFIKTEDYKKALPYFKKAVTIDPQFAFAWDNVGICERNLGNYDEAIVAYNASLAIDPLGTTPLHNLPVAYEFKKEYTKAIEAYERLFKIYPNDPESFYGAGRIYFGYLKNDEKALQNMCKAYNLYVSENSPYRVDAEKMINYIFTQMKKDGKEETFNKILKENKINPAKN